MAVVELQGTGIGIAERDYPIAAGGVAALNSFYFRYEARPSSHLPPRRVDNDLHRIGILPGGPSQDLTPEAELNAAAVPPGRLELAYMDKEQGKVQDDYFFRAAHAVIPGAVARRFQFRGLDAGAARFRLPPGLTGGPNQPAAQQSLLVLAGFTLFFTGGRDRNIDRIAVMLGDDDHVEIALSDRSGDESFFYLVDVVRISGLGLNLIRGESAGSARGGDRVALPGVPGTDLVLRGFDFNFASGDRELREIGVMRQPNRLEVFFGDKTPDDRFDWKVRWAHVGRQGVTPT